MTPATGKPSRRAHAFTYELNDPRWPGAQTHNWCDGARQPHRLCPIHNPHNNEQQRIEYR